MSHQIVYEKQFIKTDEGKIIPLIYSGSNNCYEPRNNGRWRRDRSWFPLFGKSNQAVDFEAKELLEIAHSHTGGEYQEHFVQHGKWINDAGFIRFFEYGIKYAKTLEELNELSRYPIYLSGHLSVYYDAGEKYKSEKVENSLNISSSNELTEFLEVAQKRISTKTSDEEIHIYFSFPDDKAVPYPKELRKRKAKEKLQEFYAVKVTKSPNLSCPYFINKLTSRRIYSTTLGEYAKQFATKHQAQKWVDDKNLHRRFMIETEIEFVTV